MMCFYMHCDGTPQSVAPYFYNMCLYKTETGGFAGFCRANEDVEFISDHGAVPNTAFRYNLDEDGLVTRNPRFFPNSLSS